MTTQQLRKQITVHNWLLVNGGLTIYYNKGIEDFQFTLSPEEALKMLHRIGSVYNWYSHPFINIQEDENSPNVGWEEFTRDFVFSQWEALTMVVVYELEKEADKEIENSDIGKAISNFIKPPQV